MKITEKQVDELVAKVFEDLNRWDTNHSPYTADEILGVRRVVSVELLKWQKDRRSKRARSLKSEDEGSDRSTNP
jgi:inhibitor of KinA sporulation pathway (predicted exonuclease)